MPDPTNSTGDPDADAVLSGGSPQAAAPAEITGDPDADAVLHPHQSAPASPKNVVGQVIRYEAGKIPAGLKSVYDITLGGKSAADTENAYNATNAARLTDPKAKELAAQLDQTMSSGYNPLTWPGRATDAVGNAIKDAVGLRLHSLPMSPPKVRKALDVANGDD